MTLRIGNIRTSRIKKDAFTYGKLYEETELRNSNSLYKAYVVFDPNKCRREKNTYYILQHEPHSMKFFLR